MSSFDVSSEDATFWAEADHESRFAHIGHRIGELLHNHRRKIAVAALGGISLYMGVTLYRFATPPEMAPVYAPVATTPSMPKECEELAQTLPHETQDEQAALYTAVTACARNENDAVTIITLGR